MAIFLEVVTRLGFLSVPCHRHCQPCRASPPFLGHSPFRRWCRPSLFGKHRIEKRSVFLSRLPRSQLGGLAFALLACFPPGWNGGFHLWRCSGESLGRLPLPVNSPRFKCLGCRFTWSPWLLLYCAVASVTFRLRAATAATPVHDTLRQPGFPQILRLLGCGRCLRLRILSRRSPLGRSLCSVSIFGLVSYPSG